MWASMLKARYFPNCYFFDAKKGGRASWAWSSLLVGRDLLKNDAFTGKLWMEMKFVFGSTDGSQTIPGG